MNTDWVFLWAVDCGNGRIPLHVPAFSDLWPSMWLGAIHLTFSRVLGEARGSD